MFTVELRCGNMGMDYTIILTSWNVWHFCNIGGADKIAETKIGRGIWINIRWLKMKINFSDLLKHRHK